MRTIFLTYKKRVFLRRTRLLSAYAMTQFHEVSHRQSTK